MEASPNLHSHIRLNAIRSLLLGVPRSTICQQLFHVDHRVRLFLEFFQPAILLLHSDSGHCLQRHRTKQAGLL